jgi:hypothetical protein
MAGSAGGNHPADGGGGGGGGGPNGAGGSYGSGDYNGVTGSDGADVLPTFYAVTPAVVSTGGSYGNGYVSITYEDFFGIMFNEGEITINPPKPDAPNQLQGTITHVFYQPTVITLTSAF